MTYNQSYLSTGKILAINLGIVEQAPNLETSIDTRFMTDTVVFKLSLDCLFVIIGEAAINAITVNLRICLLVGGGFTPDFTV